MEILNIQLIQSKTGKEKQKNKREREQEQIKDYKRLPGGFKEKQDLTICYPQEIYVRYKNTDRMKEKTWKNICHVGWNDYINLRKNRLQKRLLAEIEKFISQ